MPSRRKTCHKLFTYIIDYVSGGALQETEHKINRPISKVLSERTRLLTSAGAPDVCPIGIWSSRSAGLHESAEALESSPSGVGVRTAQ
jgi:hypothetical protein